MVHAEASDNIALAEVRVDYHLNGVAATAFTEWGDGVYSFEYVVSEGDEDCRADELPVSLMLEDSAGNVLVHTSSPASSSALDANSPRITNAWFEPSSGSLGVSDELKVHFVVDDEELDNGMLAGSSPTLAYP